ncbi:MAG TPA: hypothetical protein VIM53_04990 [Candidatus Saccharimonadales bacterium]
MDLRQRVLAYYLENFRQLEIPEQFHFATRMRAWLGIPEASDHLQTLRAEIVPEPATPEVFTDMFREMIRTESYDDVNALNLRAPYFAQYAPLRGLELALFRLHWLRAVYGYDARQSLLDVVNLPSLQRLEKTLLQDHDALRALSTYAVNFVYLLHQDVLGNADVPQETFYGIGASYDTRDLAQLQLFIYLYTHCILCEAGFYTQRIPAERLPMCRTMLADLEKTIGEHYDNIHLDNKLEFLVCCRVCNFSTDLSERIEAECQKSVSDEGVFLIDKHNANPQTHRRSFASSEHRNALFIMSGSAYAPHSIAVS